MKAGARSLFQVFSRLYSVRANVTLGQHVHIGPGSILWAPTALEVGSDVYIGKRCTIEVNGTIGSGTLIANNVGLVGRRDHDMHALGVPIRKAPWVGHRDDPSADRITVGPDVWIGYGAIVLAPAIIGRGAVIGAGSVVTKDVPPYSIVAGIPAATIGLRFSADQQVHHERLLRSRP